ncbi:putative reverse transcriptase domain-containing protein [Tanacetum coccineum]
MHFLLSTMSVVYVLNTPIRDDGDDAIVEQIRRRNKWENDDYVCRGMCDSLFDIYQNVESRKDINGISWRPNIWLGMYQVRSSFHLHIKESLRVQDSDKPKSNNFTSPSVVNMLEHNNSIMYNDNKDKHKNRGAKIDHNKKSKVTCWKCGKPRHLKKDCKGRKDGNKANEDHTPLCPNLEDLMPLEDLRRYSQAEDQMPITEGLMLSNEEHLFFPGIRPYASFLEGRMVPAHIDDKAYLCLHFTRDHEGTKINTSKHFKTLSLDESRSPEFDLFSDQDENFEEEVAETMTETMEQYMSKTRVDYGSGVSRPKIKDKYSFELKDQFLKELRDNTFSGSDHEDANEHIEKVLEIVNLFYIPNITQDQVMFRDFPMSLTGAASCWLRNKPSGLLTTWEDLKTKVLSKYCPLARTAKKMEEINNFQQEQDETLYQT